MATAPTPLDPDALGCEHCASPDVAAVLDGDRLCGSCADAWVRGQEPDEDEVAELRRALRGAGTYRGALIEARLYEMGVG